VLNSYNKLKVARRLGAVGIVDDKPGTLAAFNDAGYFTATLDHAYNRDIKVDCRFSDWRDVQLEYELRRRVWFQESLFAAPRRDPRRNGRSQAERLGLVPTIESEAV
jgi:hypothetical protein